MEGFMRSTSYFKTISRIPGGTMTIIRFFVLFVSAWVLAGAGCAAGFAAGAAIAGADLQKFPPKGPDSSDEMKRGAKCYSRCNSILYKCINSEDTDKSESQCEEDKQICFRQCEGKVEEEIEKRIKQKNLTGLEYCIQDCDSDLKSCMKSADGEFSEEKECKDDKEACYLKCNNWDSGEMCLGCGPYIPDTDCDPSMESCN
jgi:hypothetical protein